MRKIITTAGKELLLLKRDRTGLLVLFLMPAILVIVITLVQENVMELTGQKNTRLLFLDLDEGGLGNSLRGRLSDNNFAIVVWDKRQKNSDALQAAVAAGDYQVGVVIPEKSSHKLQQRTEGMLEESKADDMKNAPGKIPVDVFFDPGIMPGLRSGLTAQLQMALETIAMEAKITVLERKVTEIVGQFGLARDAGPLPTAGLAALFGRQLFALQDGGDSARAGTTPPYNPVQQNVPAWALFGMFFTAIPIAGAILQERRSGIWIRLASLPVSHLLLFAGKVVAYMGVCLCQFLLIGLIGVFLFPYIGLPAFVVAGHPLAVLLTVLFSSLAACGFGIVLGMACKTYEQASTLGSTVVVASAAIGGIMVPVYAMPQTMQQISIISPLNWGLTAFQDLLVRGYGGAAIVDDLGRMTLFFLLCILFAWKLARTR
ncbi:ABC transporter permease [Desulfopila sp. IMCC35006]|uniref:ABC transporter permease n=1 Tax=Desulfopila sp. IMCC35006 TaxID=2569542 RepID=UPI0010AB636D|nr:ABC transporter permease [Desulfopila sp. IMCC35006]TKB28209.1 ABC transporter permease [Desulfopila sp. IMCC35006]